MFVNDTLGSYMDKLCDNYGNYEAIVFPSTNIRYSYKQFQELYNKLAKGLIALGIKKGDHIAILELNSPVWIALQIAAAKIGCVMVCLNTGYIANELEYVLNHSESKLLLLSSGYKRNSFIDNLKELCPELESCAPGMLKSERIPKLKTVVMTDNNNYNGTITIEKLIELGSTIDDNTLNNITSEINCQDVVSIQYTSGTTGNPKAVMSTHFSVVNNALVSGGKLNYSADDKVLLCLPLFHVIGYVLSALAGLFYGSTIVVVERFETEAVFRYIEQESCTVFNGVPSMFMFMLNHESLNSYDITSLNKGFVAGSCCSKELMLDIIKKLGITELANVFGQTEAIAVSQTCFSDSLEQRLCSIGKPLEGVEAKIIDIVTGKNVGVDQAGELCIKTVYIMKGYYKDIEATQKAIDKNGWLHTGDLAVIDDSGYIKIIGRAKDMIIRGGENISPVDIENHLRLFDGIRDAAVVGIPDKLLGEEIFAFIIKEPSAQFTFDEVKEFLNKHLARFKIPKYFCFTDSFPVTSSGKIRKFALKEIAANKILFENKQKNVTVNNMKKDNVTLVSLAKTKFKIVCQKSNVRHFHD
jgi:fatty-acyl-CoA synthase